MAYFDYYYLKMLDSHANIYYINAMIVVDHRQSRASDAAKWRSQNG